MIYFRELLSTVAIALTLVAFVPYIRSIQRGTVTAHVFSWVIWGSTTSVAFLAQLAGQGGAGAWPIGVSGGISIWIAFLAYIKRADLTIKPADWFFLIAALSALPFWYLTANPLWAVVIITIVDLLGFGPTVRKAYFFPYSESLLFFALFTARNLIAIAALETYSMTTVLFPAAISVACTLLIVTIAYRRRSLLAHPNK